MVLLDEKQRVTFLHRKKVMNDIKKHDVITTFPWPPTHTRPPEKVTTKAMYVCRDMT